MRASLRGSVLTLLLTASLAAQGQGVLGVTAVDSYIEPKGAFVNEVSPGGAGAVGGLLPGDVITSLNGRAITSAVQLQQSVMTHRPGEVLTLHVVRYGNQAVDLRVTLGTPAIDARVPPAAPPAPPPSAGRPTSAAPAAAPAPRPGPGVTASSSTARPDIAWVRYTDPAEHAFSIDVPAGWRVSGGSHRMSAIEIRVGVEATSPDGTMTLFYGDLDVPPFVIPSQMLAMGGLRTGMTYSPGQGVHMLIAPYMNGQSFASDWGARRLARTCSGVSRTSARARPDSSQAIDMAYAQGGVRSSILAGEATFACSSQGVPASGYVFAATELLQSQISSMWDVKTFVGFTAPTARAAGADGLLSHMVASFAIDRNWQAREQELTRQFDRIVAQTNAAVSHAIIENGKALSAASDRIFQQGQQRSAATMNAIDKYDEYGIRGTSDFVNPSTGTTYGSLDNSYAHTYVSPDQQITQTDSENSPGPGWTEIHPQR